MITRVWRGRTSLTRADAYEAFLKETAYPDYGDVDGNRGWLLLRRPGTGSDPAHRHPLEYGPGRSATAGSTRRSATC